MKLNNKIILVSLLIFIGVISVICIFLLNKHDTDEEISNKTYIAYININPLIKFKNN